MIPALIRRAVTLTRLGALAAVAVGASAGAQATTATTAPAALPAAPVVADTGLPLSLEDAVRLAETASEGVRIARAGAQRANGDVWRARSQLLPQVYGSLQYTKTLKSQFEALQGPADTRDPCEVFVPTATTDSARIVELQQKLALATDCSPAGGLDFSKVGFGAKNQYQVGLSFSQNLFTGGRVVSQYRAAEAGRRAADIEVRAQRAQAVLEVTQAYYDAVLADRLAVIAESSLVQTENVLKQTTLARQVGNTSEFELLRARVTRDNQVPLLIQRRSGREVAVLRLKQLLELPLDRPLRLTTDLQDDTPPPAARFAAFGGAAAADTATANRGVVKQADENVRAQEAALRIARAGRLPAISLTSQYGRVAYPASGVPQWNDFIQNWTVGVGLRVPLFTGGLMHGEELVARGNLAEAKARRSQAREYAALDALTSLTALREAEAQWSASAGTAEQAGRAYTIAELRYREGISTQVELSDARLLLQQSQANRALAARNLQVARVRLALLRDLPLGTQGAGGTQGIEQQQLQGAAPSAPRQQTTPQGQSADFSQAGQTGGIVP